MIFNSVTYLLFLVLVVALYWTLPRTPRLYMIFGASILFYGFWRFEFVPVMLASAVTDYFAALGISRTTRPATRKMWLASSLLVNLGLVFDFAAGIASLNPAVFSAYPEFSTLASILS